LFFQNKSFVDEKSWKSIRRSALLLYPRYRDYTLVISIFGTILRSLNSKKLKFGATIDFSEGLENTPFKTKITSA
jgi:hypothetical protein